MKIAVYSCLVGTMDKIQNVKKEKGVDYIMFTDQDVKTNWELRPLPKEALECSTDPRRQSRYVKINPHKVLSEYDYTIYIDANLDLARDTKEFIEKLGDSDMLLRRHPVRNCAYHEAKVVKHYGFDSHQAVDKTVNFLRKRGFPKQHGLTENGLIVRKMNEETERFNELWWETYCEFSRRDQLTFMYCQWKLCTKMVIVNPDVITMRPHARNTRGIVEKNETHSD